MNKAKQYFMTADSLHKTTLLFAIVPSGYFAYLLLRSLLEGFFPSQLGYEPGIAGLNFILIMIFLAPPFSIYLLLLFFSEKSKKFREIWLMLSLLTGVSLTAFILSMIFVGERLFGI